MFCYCNMSFHSNFNIQINFPKSKLALAQAAIQLSLLSHFPWEVFPALLQRRSMLLSSYNRLFRGCSGASEDNIDLIFVRQQYKKNKILMFQNCSHSAPRNSDMSARRKKFKGSCIICLKSILVYI